MDAKNNTIIFFSEKANAALSEIEKKYSLEESDEEWMEKLKNKKMFNINIIADLAKKFFGTEISKEQFISSLQKDVNVNEETSIKIFADVEARVIPYTKKISEENIQKGIAQDQIEQPEEAAQVSIEKRTIEKLSGRPSDTRSPGNKSQKKGAIIKPNLTETDIPIKKTKGGTDKYREPIG